MTSSRNTPNTALFYTVQHWTAGTYRDYNQLTITVLEMQCHDYGDGPKYYRNRKFKLETYHESGKDYSQYGRMDFNTIDAHTIEYMAWMTATLRRLETQIKKIATAENNAKAEPDGYFYPPDLDLASPYLIVKALDKIAAYAVYDPRESKEVPIDQVKPINQSRYFDDINLYGTREYSSIICSVFAENETQAQPLIMADFTRQMAELDRSRDYDEKKYQQLYTRFMEWLDAGQPVRTGYREEAPDIRPALEILKDNTAPPEPEPAQDTADSDSNLLIDVLNN